MNLSSEIALYTLHQAVVTSNKSIHKTNNDEKQSACSLA